MRQHNRFALHAMLQKIEIPLMEDVESLPLFSAEEDQKLEQAMLRAQERKRGEMGANG